MNDIDKMRRRLVEQGVKANISSILELLPQEVTKELDTFAYLADDEDPSGDSDIEVSGHFIVDDYLGRLLKDEGEMVVDIAGSDVWCRTVYGQLIEDDACIRKIANKLVEEK